MMMKKYGLITKVLLISMFAILLNGCENSLTSEFSSKANEAKFYTITGNIDVDAISAENSSRTGRPTIPSIDDDNIKFSVSATKDGKTITGTVTGMQYSITLLKGSWTITVIGEKAGVKVLEGSITVNTEVAPTTQQTITLKTINAGTGTGSLSLTISKDASISCGGVKATLYKKSGEESNDVKYLTFNTTTNNSTKWEITNLPVGTYEIKLDFYQTMTLNADGTSSCENLLYSHHDTVNIFADLVTNTWTGSGYSENSFTLTKAMITSFAMSTFYVDGTNGDDSKAGTYFAPFKTLQKAVEKINGINDGVSPYTIYVMDNITLGDDSSGTTSSAFINIAPEKSLKLKICGYNNQSVTIDANQKGSVMYIANNDIAEEAKTIVTLENITLTGGKSTGAGGATVFIGGELIMNSGATIDSCESTGNGGGVQVSGGTFTMSTNAKIKNCVAGKGGAVYLANGTNGTNGTFEMSGGSIENCKANNALNDYGGGVYMENGTFNMSGGTISGCTAEQGGGVYVAGGKITMKDGTISNCTAITHGGGVYLASTVENAFTMEGGTIDMCTVYNDQTDADSYGGGVYLASNTTFNMTGGTISNCEVYNSYSDKNAYGGGVYLGGSTFFDMSGGTISECEANYGGGVSMGGSDCCFTMSGSAKINTCRASKSGGGVYQNDGEFEMSGGTISDCTAEQGGGVCVANGAIFTMSGDSSSITGNTASSDVAALGGGVCVATGGKFEMKSGSIKSNNAINKGTAILFGGGGVAVKVDKFNNIVTSIGSFIMSGGSISENTAINGSGSGVFIMGAPSQDTNVTEPIFKISKGAVVNSDNDVYLEGSTAMITIAWPLDNSSVATITPDSYTVGRQVLTSSGNSFPTDQVSKFAVTPQTTTDETIKWTIDDTNGYLKKQQ